MSEDNTKQDETTARNEEEPIETDSTVDVEVTSAGDNPSDTATKAKTDEAPETLEPVTLTGEEHKKLNEQAEKSAEYWDRFVRLNAEFDNYKKRAARERLDAIKYANEALLETLIPTLDNFEMAMMAVENASADSIESLKQGITMVHKQLRDVIAEAGMEEIDAANQSFDPAWHEAISQQESDEVPEGQVIQQVRKGYKLKERLIRPANVIVAKAKGESGDADSAADTDQ